MSPTISLLHAQVWMVLVREALDFRAAGCGVGRVAVFSEALAVAVSEALVVVEPIQCLIL
jgi:hypothetical protein